jgi:glycosyltransferase involved in cell wall biosynthesis
MSSAGQPLVSIVTPVYNGEPYLRQCIESVLSQSYGNWDYVIVNNCSTDRTLEIAQEYAARDPRIHVHSNERFAPVIENHNIALRQISVESKYCKMVFADDWLFPECLSEMVKVAERYPSLGIVGAYGLDGKEVLWEGLAYPCTFISGRELCRNTLLGGPYVFGTPTSLLIRADLIRSKNAFYNEENLHADNEVCYEILQQADFGFVHQILTFSRPRPGSNTTTARNLESYVLGNLSAIISHGPVFLTAQEYEARREQWLKQYYKVLAKSFLRMREQKFWEFHRARLMQLGSPLNRSRLFRAVAREMLASFARPMDILDGVLNWWPQAFSRARTKPTQ